MVFTVALRSMGPHTWVIELYVNPTITAVSAERGLIFQGKAPAFKAEQFGLVFVKLTIFAPLPSALDLTTAFILHRVCVPSIITVNPPSMDMRVATGLN